MLFETNQLEAVEGYPRDAEVAATASVEAVEAADETANELHVYNICTKLTVRSRSQAVARARALRLL